MPIRQRFLRSSTDVGISPLLQYCTFKPLQAGNIFIQRAGVFENESGLFGTEVIVTSSDRHAVVGAV